MLNYVHVCTDSYSAWIEACEDRVRRRIKQRWCPGCGRWRWDDERCPECPPAMETRRMTKAKFEAMARTVAKKMRRRYPTQEDRYREEMKQMRRGGSYD